MGLRRPTNIESENNKAIPYFKLSDRLSRGDRDRTDHYELQAGIPAVGAVGKLSTAGALRLRHPHVAATTALAARPHAFRAWTPSCSSPSISACSSMLAPPIYKSLKLAARLVLARTSGIVLNHIATPRIRTLSLPTTPVPAMPCCVDQPDGPDFCCVSPFEAASPVSWHRRCCDESISNSASARFTYLCSPSSGVLNPCAQAHCAICSPATPRDGAARWRTHAWRRR